MHASSAEDALHRINRLAQQGFDFREEIERMVGVVVFISEKGQQRIVNILNLV